MNFPDMGELSHERKRRISGSALENISICLVWPRVISSFSSLHGASLYALERPVVQVASQTVVHLIES